MTEQRLNNILLLHAHKEMMDALNLTEIARLFVSCNARRVEFFGNFVWLCVYFLYKFSYFDMRFEPSIA